MTLLVSVFTSDWAQDLSTIDRVHGDLKLLQQALVTEVVGECLAKFQGSVSNFCCDLRVACDTQDPPLDHLQQFQSELNELDLVYPQLATLPDNFAEPATTLHVRGTQDTEWCYLLALQAFLNGASKRRPKGYLAASQLWRRGVAERLNRGQDLPQDSEGAAAAPTQFALWQQFSRECYQPNTCIS